MAIYYARANGNINATNVWSTTAAGATSDLFPSFTNADTLMANGFTVTINVNTTVLEIRTDTTGGATAGGSFALNGNITLNANVYSGSTTCVTCTFTAGNSSTINGSITGPSTGLNQSGVNFTGSGTLNINGNIIGPGIQGNSVQLNSGGIINITGSVSGSSSANNGIAVSLISTGTINITGNLLGGGATSAHATQNSNAGTINITGNVTGGSGTTSYGINNTSIGTFTVVGIVIGGTGSLGALNNSTGTLTVTRAKGNGFGNGSVGLTSQVGVLGVQTGLTRVYEIEYGDLGQSPTGGPVFLFPASSNVALFYRSGTSKKTLVDAASSSGLLPNASDVRSGITYNAGTNTGTMSVPTAASVASGVAVDNTTGTAILTTNNIADIWNYPVSGISVSNSIGERLKNCSTVATMGQQLAAALNNVQ